MEQEKLELSRIVEEKLDEFSERVSKVEEKVSEIEEATKKSFQDYLKYIELVSQNIYFDMSIGNQLSQLEDLTTGEVSLFDNVVDKILKKSRTHNQIDSLQLPVVTLPLHYQIETVIRLSKKWNIPFKKVSSYLVDKLGKEEAEKLVGKENITKHYGKEAFSTWKSSLKKAK